MSAATKTEAPLAIDVCPNARRCQHNASTRIGPSGACPDCGRAIYARGARPGGHTSNSAAAVGTQAAYHGGLE